MACVRCVFKRIYMVVLSCLIACKIRFSTHILSLNILYLGGRGGKTPLAASKGRGRGMGEDDDFEEEDESDGSGSTSESSDEEDAQPRAKTVRSIIHEVGLSSLEKEGGVHL